QPRDGVAQDPSELPGLLVLMDDFEAVVLLCHCLTVRLVYCYPCGAHAGVVDHAVEILQPPGVLHWVRGGWRCRLRWTRHPPDRDTHRLTCTYAQAMRSSPQPLLSRLWMTRPRHDTHTKCWGPVFLAPQGVVSIPSGGPGDR